MASETLAALVDGEFAIERGRCVSRRQRTIARFGYGAAKHIAGALDACGRLISRCKQF